MPVQAVIAYKVTTVVVEEPARPVRVAQPNLLMILILLLVVHPLIALLVLLGNFHPGIERGLGIQPRQPQVVRIVRILMLVG